MSKDKLWGGRFAQPTNKFVEEFTASIDFDKRLYHQDIRGSIAHARMLGKQGIIPIADVESIVHGLQHILEQIEAGHFEEAEKSVRTALAEDPEDAFQLGLCEARYPRLLSGAMHTAG